VRAKVKERFTAARSSLHLIVHLVLALLLLAQPAAPQAESTFSDRLAAAALAQLEHRVWYDPSYYRIPYPNGDVPDSVGVCTDVIVRAYRSVGVDLQKLVHEDVVSSLRGYGITRADASIDHRRVPNLMKFFKRQGAALPVSGSAQDYRAGDVVAWQLAPGLTHIGIVVWKPDSTAEAPLVVHNIGRYMRGPDLEDCLFNWPVIGHYRYDGDSRK
jgi:uncharacterized protein YijF (DUF1287 family)